jgi:hypothetical protein
MDIFILGSVPPYSDLLCGKLIALAASSNEVRAIVQKKYSETTTIIERVKKDPRLVLLTTTSALGRSSLYNRISMPDRRIYERIGVSLGWGHFHLSNGTFAAMKGYLESIGHPVVSAHEYGCGPNWKIRLARTCLEQLGLSQDLLRHGIRRELYVVSLARNFRDFLLGDAQEPDLYDLPMEDIIKFFKERWFIPRSIRTQNYFSHTRSAVLETIHSGWNAMR